MEAVTHIYSCNVLHDDIQPTNNLLDKYLHLKLSDFQGQHLSKEGEVLLEGGSSEPCRFYLTREDRFFKDMKTELFALRCTLYFIVMGYAMFPGIVDGSDGWHERVEDMLSKQKIPTGRSRL